ncbi:MAG: site-2 protease family protein [Clostridiales bacterium]|nr:site-2 protease family protein [Clostridiales bacterium]
MTIFFVLAALLLLGIMVMVHECGHFFAARLTGIPVKGFGIGFGPKLLSKVSSKTGTEYVWRLIPAGGYCSFYGEDETDGKSKDDPRALHNHAVWKRFLTIAMGPVMNFVLALVVACGFFLVMGEVTGVDYGYVRIESVNPGSAAKEGGLLAGDKIILINGEDMKGLAGDGESFKALSMIDAFREGDKPLKMTVERDGNAADVFVTPRMDAAEGRMMVGITCLIEAESITQKCSLFRAAKLSLDYCFTTATLVLDALKGLVTTGEGLDETGGPVRIIETITTATRDYGFAAYVEMLIAISVNLGLMNLLPIPGLDGSRMVFLAIEGIFRRPVNRNVEAYIHMAGFVFLIGVLIFFTYRDILHLFR